jgi:regulator of replication initiation timing
MPTQKTPQLLKIEALARLANQINSISNQINFAKKAIENGVEANAQLGLPALSAQEISNLIDPQVIALLNSIQ